MKVDKRTVHLDQVFTIFSFTNTEMNIYSFWLFFFCFFLLSPLQIWKGSFLNFFPASSSFLSFLLYELFFYLFSDFLKFLDKYYLGYQSTPVVT